MHREFHRAVYAASHNDVMIKLLDDLWDKSDRYRRIGLELPSGDEPRTIDLNQHHQILELVIAGDGAGAAELARTHIANSLTASVTGALEERENVQSPPWRKPPSIRRLPSDRQGSRPLSAVVYRHCNDADLPQDLARGLRLAACALGARAPPDLGSGGRARHGGASFGAGYPAFPA